MCMRLRRQRCYRLSIPAIGDIQRGRGKKTRSLQVAENPITLTQTGAAKVPLSPMAIA